MYNLDEPDIEVYMEVKRILKKWKKEEPIFRGAQEIQQEHCKGKTITEMSGFFK